MHYYLTVSQLCVSKKRQCFVPVTWRQEVQQEMSYKLFSWKNDIRARDLWEFTDFTDLFTQEFLSQHLVKWADRKNGSPVCSQYQFYWEKSLFLPSFLLIITGSYIAFSPCMRVARGVCSSEAGKADGFMMWWEFTSGMQSSWVTTRTMSSSGNRELHLISV